MQMIKTNSYSVSERVIRLADWLKRRLAAIYSLNEAEIDLDSPISDYGLDSLNALAIAGEFEEMLDFELPSTLLCDYPTIRKVSEYLNDQLLNRNIH